MKIAGDQHGPPATPLPNPFVVEVRDGDGLRLEGVSVAFGITAGGGTLSTTSTTTDADGRARSVLTLGPNSGTTIVSVAASGIETPVTFTAVARDGVVIPDSNLRAAVGNMLGKAPGAPLVPAEIATLTEFYAPEASIGDLTGLEFAINLIWLDLDDNSISDLSPVSGLTNLTALYLYNNDISNISAISGLTKLTELVLAENNISDISAVSGFTNLTWLNLGENSISDVSPVSGLTNLTTLYLYNNDISNISAISGLTKLTDFELNGNNISNISPVSGFTNLTWLDLGENSISDVSPVSGLTNLTTLYLYNNNISNISAISGMTNLTQLWLAENDISDISAISGLTNLTWLGLAGNSISDLSPLVSNMGLGEGDFVSVEVNPLSYASIHVSIPTLQGRGVEAVFFDRTPTALLKISGDRQTGKSGAELANPFVVEVRDSNNSAFEGVPVTYTVTQGGGTLSVRSTKTDANGRAESTLTLGPNPETNTVEVTPTGIQVKQTFNAEGIRIPKTFEVISGNDQQGVPGTAVEKPFVVEVRDQSDKPLPDVKVTFSVASGGGTLSATSATTDTNGRAESTLTLGPESGTNTVTVSVTGIQEEQTVSAIAESLRIPQDVNGDDVVNIVDLVLVASVLGTVGQDSAADVNGDEVVNILDLVSVAAVLGNAAAAPTSDSRVLAMLAATDVRGWLAQARQLNLVDATSQRGVLFLEQLLVALPPKETILLPNYPNPFNPETWIPYQLSQPSDVTLTVYSVAGEVVRRLALGHQPAGTYQSQNRAAYWDGKNQFGESVVSGIYFYTFIASDFAAKRKMLIRK